MFGGSMVEMETQQNAMASFQSQESDTDSKYMKKYQGIMRRCNSIQKENEMLVNRVYQVKRIVRRLRRERKFLMEELDKRGDNYRNLPLTIAIDEDDKAFALPQTSSLPALGRPRSSSTLTTGKRPAKREKGEREAGAPKRPSSAFMQFCQDQREISSAHHLQTTGRPIDKKQLTKLLSARWNALAEEDKKVYIDKFERDKERYSEEKRLYDSRKLDQSQ